ncbi:putative proteasome subunit beta type-1 [Schizosaccharomyces pombe]|uniref:Probable proteasome subunit beta type-1 n=1 Tax=Schizosaccharomyces pombe (strain 972 / ATCC 24843) TaxID=284812 RepID=PSB1_SCHPO|nr:putative proteasome core particle subunit beta 1 Pre3 [Schizosaccharomyces pombe]O43063.1 RecName: Full=Probable proteasome subunit beta type-1; Flags: Precursor [Schizosaccharomyces pombe 972h-]CAA16832.1 20S proteasome component beta 1 Pre3 (predicted) [Schizosaccharomyces pombe]|eukprot:NP_596295.1 putative proteasome core particle subunit beta 1 Pre3 [Schizosaccharomyces pombe]
MATTVKDTMNVDINAIKKGEIRMGTTITALRYKDGVILAADSRTTMGAYIANRVTDKLTQLTDNIWCCRSGSAADTQTVADLLKYYLSMYRIQFGHDPSVHTAATLASEMCYQNKNMLSAGLIVAGYDEKTGGDVYSIPLGGSLHKQPLAIGGSGSAFIYGFCDANFRENMTQEEAVEFLKNAVALAMERDGSSGGTIRMVILNKDGMERKFFAIDTANPIPVFTH